MLLLVVVSPASPGAGGDDGDDGDEAVGAVTVSMPPAAASMFW